MGSVKEKIINHLQETWATSWELIRIIIPVAIVTRVLEQAGVIEYLAALMNPLMGVMGLPGELGLVWGTTVLTSLYGGIAVFAELAPGLELTTLQITVLCSAMLIAHSFPVELSISRRAGANMLSIGLLRFGGAVLYCCIFYGVGNHFQLWQDVPRLLFKTIHETSGIWGWMLGLVKNIGLIIAVICLILILMKLLRYSGVLEKLERLLTPVLSVFGMGKNAAPITVIGMLMGLSYGGALIIREAAGGKMTKSEIFYAMALMGLCHSLVEDTVLMLAIGGNLAGCFWGRIVFSLVVVYVLACLGKLLLPALSSPEKK